MDKYAPQKKYLKQNQRKMTISFITKTEADILEQIDKQPNKWLMKLRRSMSYWLSEE